jgi:membrane associated rhomboid family serine protease
VFVPIGLDQTTVRRLPWVSFAIIALNFVVFLAVGAQVRNAEEEITRRGQEVMAYWGLHPYLAFPTKMLPAGMPEPQRERIGLLAEGMRSLSGKAPASDEQRGQEQHELDRLVEVFREAVTEHPFKVWGLVPANPRAIAFLTSMFMHAGWLHLLGNMLFFYIAGPFLEDAYGRPLFAALYLTSGVVSSLVHVAAFRASEAPLVGASGAIAGLMGAFLVRFLRAKVRFFYFYFFFIIRSGTVDIPAWIVLPLWFLQQLFFAGLSAESGVAYRAHVGGFIFGFLAALAIKQLRIEERFVAPKIEKEISVTQHPALEEGMEFLARGETGAARAAFLKVLASEPRNADAHLALWQSHCQDGTAKQGVEHLVRAMDEELRRGDAALALGHWREMVAGAGQGGPGALRFRLASMLETVDRNAAIEILRHLSGDPTAGLLAEKATRRLAALGAVPGPSSPAPPLMAAPALRPREVAAPHPAHPVATPAASVVPSLDSKRPEAAADVFVVEPEPKPNPAEPASLVFADAPTQEATMPEPPEPAGHEVEECALDTVQPEGLMIRGAVGGPELVPFVEVEKVSVAGITGSPRPHLVLDLVLRVSPGHPRTVERLLSSQFDPRHVIGRPDLPPLEAFRELVRTIAQASNAALTPPTILVPSVKIPTFESLEVYEREVLAALM